MAKSVFGIARTEDQAIRIANDLRAAGFRDNDISVLFPDKQGTRDFAHEQHTKAPEGAVSGAVTGGVIGGALGWLVGIGSLAIPGLGPFIAAGPILAALSGVAAGGTAGGIVGALVGMGIPEYEAKRYEGKIREGNILISVHTDNSDEVSRAKDIFRNAGAEDIAYTGEESVDGQTRDASYDASVRRSTEPYEAQPYTLYEPSFRENFTSMYGHTGRPYTDYEPAYRYGYSLATDPRYRDSEWDVVEPEARRGWTQQGRGAWEEFKDAVRGAWDRVRGRRSPEHASLGR
ncbi:MAG TPA: hypothetical protein VJQ54_10015 [Candidatus Sulfotelmatobacter sp.]|nr:hypothetical protein [Candidatus Sulfotelmatobacter sp.]